MMNIRCRDRTSKMQLILLFIIKPLSQHVSDISMSIVRRIRPCPIACGVLPGYVRCGCLWSCGSALWAMSTVWNFHTVLMAHNAYPQDQSQPQPTHPGRTPHAIGHDLILLTMGIMMPKTCWDRGLIINNKISCILLVLSLHLICFFVTVEDVHILAALSYGNCPVI